ncbi:MAG: glycosyltransferase family 1 protein [Firmicutes bacterium]|nr:glycosyltransferase family 1 protein [Bacillota bacterium]
MDKINVLIDMFEGRHGYAGISTDMRSAFLALARSEPLKITGLVYSGGDVGVETLNPIHKVSNAEVGLRMARIIHDLHGERLPSNFLQKVESLTSGKKFLNTGKIAKNIRYWINSFFKYGTYPIDPAVYYDAIWRGLFDKTLEPSEIDTIKLTEFVFSDIHRWGSWASLSKFKRPWRMSPTDHQVVISFNISPIKYGVNQISRVHDLIPLVRPDVVHYEDIRKFRTHLEFTLAQARRIACVSHSAADDLRRFYPSTEGIIDVIPCMTTSGFYPVADERRLFPIFEGKRSEYQRKMEKSSKRRVEPPRALTYFVYHGTIESRKNVNYLCKAFEELTDSDEKYQNLKLVIAGHFGWMYQNSQKSMANLIAKGRLIHLEGVNTAELRVLLSNSIGHVFPSLYEGFGLPPIEAMQCGAPPIVSNVSSHPEIVGDAGLYCDPYDSDTLSREMARLADDRGGQLRKYLQSRAEIQLKKYHPDRVTPLWESSIEKAAQLSRVSQKVKHRVMG